MTKTPLGRSQSAAPSFAVSKKEEGASGGGREYAFSRDKATAHTVRERVSKEATSAEEVARKVVGCVCVCVRMGG